MIVAAWAVTALLSFLLAWLWWRGALRRGWVDFPGHRSSHVLPTARGGGIGPWLAMLAALLLAQPLGMANAGVVAALALAGLVGLVDDLRPLPATLKLAGQTLAALPLAFALPLAGLPLSDGAWPGAAGIALAAALAVFLMNAWNFMDGIDGIAALASAAMAAIALLSGESSLAPWLLAATLGFLPLNYPRARLFMGDCGSHVLGLSIAVLLLEAQHGAAGTAGFPASPGVPALLAACAPFVVDVVGTLVKRARRGERLASAHRQHLYQQMVQRGYSHALVSAGYAGVMLVAGGAVHGIDATTGGGHWAVLAAYGLTASVWAWLGRGARVVTSGARSP